MCRTTHSSRKRADSPQRHRVRRIVEKRSIAVDLLGIAGIDLQVSQQMPDDVAEQHHAVTAMTAFLPIGAS